MEPTTLPLPSLQTATPPAGGQTAGLAASPGQTLQGMERLKEHIWRKRPILGDIMHKHGNKNLYEYSKDFLDVNPAPRLDARKEEFIAVVQALLRERLSSDIAQRAADQLRRLPLVSTADHHSTIDHPFWVNANIISALPYFEHAAEIPFLIVLSFASVSINNASGYPRGILFHGNADGTGELIRLPLLPDKLKMGVVHGMRAFTAEDLERAKTDLRGKTRNGSVCAERCEQVSAMLDEVFGAPDVLSLPTLSSQITKINHRLWPKLFHAPGTQHAMPDLLYVEIETIVTELLQRHHLQNAASLIHKLLFNADWQSCAQRAFDSLAGGFSSSAGWGTYLFWGVDAKHHRVSLHLQHGELTNADHSECTVAWSPEGIAAGLREGKIFPSMLLCYIVTSLFYGMKCLGGFCQVHDLTVIKQVWQDMLSMLGHNEEALAITPVQTRELGGDGMVLAYVRTATGGLVPATGIDMALSPNDTSVEKYLERSKTVTLMEMMNPMLPEMYTVLYSAPDRDPELCTVTPDMIIDATGIDKKLLQTATFIR